MPESEPRSEADVAAWIAAAARAQDSFAAVYDASERHRDEHGPACDVYPSSSGPLLGALVASSGANRILEVGCGLGYGALWLAHGSGPDAVVEACEALPEHAALAREQIGPHDASRRITVRDGRASAILRDAADASYDFIFCDGDPADYPADLPQFVRVLRPGGTLLTSNLFLGIYVPDAPWLADAAAYRDAVLAQPQLQTAFLPRGMALSVKRAT